MMLGSSWSPSPHRGSRSPCQARGAFVTSHRAGGAHDGAILKEPFVAPSRRSPSPRCCGAAPRRGVPEEPLATPFRISFLLRRARGPPCCAALEESVAVFHQRNPSPCSLAGASCHPTPDDAFVVLVWRSPSPSHAMPEHPVAMLPPRSLLPHQPRAACNPWHAGGAPRCAASEDPLAAVPWRIPSPLHPGGAPRCAASEDPLAAMPWRIPSLR